MADNTENKGPTATMATVSAAASILSLDEKSVAIETKEFFMFELDDELYAAPVLAVDQVIRIPPITRVPNASRGIVGVFHLRGKVIVALDMAQHLGIPRRRLSIPMYLFITHKEKNHYAILIDRPRVVTRVPVAAITPPDPLTAARINEKYTDGTFVYHDNIVKKTKKKEYSFMILPKGQLAEPEPEEAPRGTPVLILRLNDILDEETLGAREARAASDGAVSQSTA
jgi:purine-binding chemotaxis protein CheW